MAKQHNMNRFQTYRGPYNKNNFTGSDLPGGSDTNHAVDDNQTAINTNGNGSRSVRSVGYTMITPQDEKRKKLLEGAAKEAEQYEKHLESKRSCPIKESPRLLGGQVSQREAVSRKQKEVKISSQISGLKMKEKREKYIREKKEQEDKKYKEVKEKARLQAERNEQKEKERKMALSGDHKRTNLEFLKKLEHSHSSSTVSSTSNFSPNINQDQRHYYASKLSACEQPTTTNMPPQNLGLDYLSSLFPLYDKKDLAAVLKDCGGSVEKARKLLDG